MDSLAVTAREMEKPIRLPPTEMWKFSFSLSGGVESQQEVDYLSALCLSPLPIIRTADVDGANAFFFSSFRPYFPMIKRTEKKTKDRKETKKKMENKKETK